MTIIINNIITIKDNTSYYFIYNMTTKQNKIIQTRVSVCQVRYNIDRHRPTINLWSIKNCTKIGRPRPTVDLRSP